MNGSFVLHKEYQPEIEMLTDEEAGQLIKAIYAFECGKELPTLTGGARLLFSIFKRHTDDSSEKREEPCKRGQGSAPKKSRTRKKATETAKEAEASSENPANNSIDVEHGESESTHSVNADIDERFTQFWQAYPRKTAKLDALKAWRKLEPDAYLLDEILAAVERDKQSEQWKQDNGQFIPYPATWINQRRWEDEPMQSQIEQQVYDFPDYGNEEEYL